MASRKEFLDSMRAGMRLDKDFFLKIYGYDISWPGFAENALQRLEFLGCSKARAYYSSVILEYEYQREKELKEVAAWYHSVCGREWKRKEVQGSRVREKNALQEMSNNELLTYLENLSGAV